jgi:hypothetical protein
MKSPLISIILFAMSSHAEDGPAEKVLDMKRWASRPFQRKISLNRRYCKDHGAPERMRGDLDQQISFPEIQDEAPGSNLFIASMAAT